MSRAGWRKFKAGLKKFGKGVAKVAKGAWNVGKKVAKPLINTAAQSGAAIGSMFGQKGAAAGAAIQGAAGVLKGVTGS